MRVSAEAAGAPRAANPSTVVVNRGRQQRATRDTVVLPIRQGSEQKPYPCNPATVKTERTFGRDFPICRGPTNSGRGDLGQPSRAVGVEAERRRELVRE